MMSIYDFMTYYRFDSKASGDNLEEMIELSKAVFENHKGPYVVCVCNKYHEVVFYLEKEE